MTANAPGKTVLMQGNEAIVRGAVESGIHFAASYPGSPSSQILGMLGKIAKERNFYAQWATNEICAFQLHLHREAERAAVHRGRAVLCGAARDQGRRRRGHER